MIAGPAGQAAPWYLAQLRPNALAIARRNLLRQGFDTFCPMQPATRKTPRGFVPDIKPLFPGYVFVSFDPAVPGWSAINGTLGVARLVSFGSRPEPVPADLVAALRLRCGPDDCLLPPDDLGPGDLVRVTAGPFADFVCTIEAIDTDRRVWVLLDLMGRQARVAFRPDQLRRA